MVYELRVATVCKQAFKISCAGWPRAGPRDFEAMLGEGKREGGTLGVGIPSKDT
jgi:hypothetical protein